MRTGLFCCILLSAMTPGQLIAAAGEEYMQRSPKQEIKRAEAVAKLTPETIAKLTKIKSDAMEPLATFDTAEAFKWKGGFTDSVRADNFLRAFANSDGSGISYQVYQTITYLQEARRFDRVNIMLPAGLKTISLTKIATEVDCAYGTCVYTETLGFTLSEEDIDALAMQYAQDTKAVLRLRYKSPTGLDWNDDMAVVEIVGLLQAIESWKQREGITD